MQNLSTQTLAEPGKCALNVDGTVLAECEDSPAARSYDSWQHVLDADDVKALRAGRSMPMNQTAHDIITKKMESALKALVEDPDRLKHTVAERRMSHEKRIGLSSLQSLHGLQPIHKEGKTRCDRMSKASSGSELVSM